MSETRLNAYKIMWLFVMFDLPTQTKKNRRDSANFRKNLERDGFVMHQFSIYIRFCASFESAEVHIKRVRSFVPEFGRVTILTVTDKQYANIINIWGKIEQKIQKKPIQLEFF
jgi:CRISPR-associated protein Cas2